LIDTSDFRNGLSIVVEGEVFQIVEFQHVKPGKGGAFVRTRLKNLRTGNVLEKTFRAGEKMDQAVLDRKKMSFLYNQGDDYVFMDEETFDQVTIPAGVIGPQVKYLKDATVVEVCAFDQRILAVELPFFMEFEVVDTDPGLRGDTASGGSKPARLETGAVVNVPLFINIGDRIRVDTRTDAYLERVK
jgi:elongation factor P